MNELSRHIEILLLDNDCVIVPGFGGFMAHHAPAVYLEESGTFYPPQRTLGFNPQLQFNDSLLAQSYVEAYDISYPEAVRKIEGEVEEICQCIDLNGEYEFHGIGLITLKSSGKYDFQPCAAGLLTPSLYALDSLCIDLLEQPQTTAEAPTIAISPAVSEKKPETIVLETATEEDYEEGLLVRHKTMRNVLAAAIMLCLIAFACIPAGLGSLALQKSSIIDTELITSFFSFNDKPVVKPAKTTHVVVHKKVTKKATEAAEASQAAAKPSVTVAKQAETVSKAAEAAPESFYTIVLASQVSKRGAENYVAELTQDGMKDVTVYERGSSRKVIYGKFKSAEQAQQELNSLRASHEDMEQAWTTEIHQ